MDHYLARSWIIKFIKHAANYKFNLSPWPVGPTWRFTYWRPTMRWSRIYMQKMKRSTSETFCSIWKVSRPNLDNSKAGSLLHLKSLFEKLKKDPDKFEQYENIIKRSTRRRNHQREKSQPNVKGYHISHKPDKTQKVRKCE